MECKEAVSLIHEYFDGELYDAHLLDLNKHLQVCSGCHKRFKQIERMEAHIRTLCPPVISETSTENIMSCLPAARKRNKMVSWLRRHPALTAAAIFVIVMISSLASLWGSDQDLMVKVNNQDKVKVIIEGNRVIVPAGQTIEGDLVVENGEIVIDGNITGNLVAIDSSYTASTAHIAGKITVVNRMFDWIWYKIAGLF